MKLLTVTPESRSEVVRETAECLRAGGIALIPTDTVYGLAAHPGQSAAVARIFGIKGRQADKPIALLAADLDAVERHGAELAPAARRLAEAFWPGALTLVVPCGGTFEGFRVPDHPFVRELLAACGGVLRVTSANRSGAAPAASAEEALRDVGLEVDVAVDAGPCPGGVPSSVVKVSAASVDVLRPGALPADRLLQAGNGAPPDSRPPDAAPG
jgi:L-threonylcarbamoyladenylate synthase